SACVLPDAPITTTGLPSTYSVARFNWSRVKPSVTWSVLPWGTNLSALQSTAILRVPTPRKPPKSITAARGRPSRSTMTLVIAPISSPVLLTTFLPTTPWISSLPSTTALPGAAGACVSGGACAGGDACAGGGASAAGGSVPAPASAAQAAAGATKQPMPAITSNPPSLRRFAVWRMLTAPLAPCSGRATGKIPSPAACRFEAASQLRLSRDWRGRDFGLPAGIGSGVGGGAVQHGDDLAGGFHFGEDAGHGLELGLMRVAMHLGNRVADKDHAVIVFDAAAHGGRDADAGGDAANDASGNAEIAQDRVERRIREAAKALLHHKMLARQRLQLVDDLRAPGPFGDEGAVAAERAARRAPIGKLRVRIIRLQDMGDIDDGTAGATEGVRQALRIGHRAHEEGQIDLRLWIFARPMREASLGMDEIILHVDDDQRRAIDIRAAWIHRHGSLPGMATC